REQRRPLPRPRDDLPRRLRERPAGNGERDEVRSREVRAGQRAGVEPVRQDDVVEVARVSPVADDGVGLGGVAADQRRRVPLEREQARERRAPAAAADDEDPHERLLKSMITGAPSRPSRRRSWFSTKYA